MPILLFIAAIAGTLLGGAQVSETRTVADFTAIHSASGVNVYYTQSSEKSVKVETDDAEKLRQIITEVKGGTLNVYIKNDRKHRNLSFKVLNVYVSAPNVSALKADSGSRMELKNEVVSRSEMRIDLSSGASILGDFKANDVTLNASSGSDYKGNVQATNLKADISSGSGVKISGTAQTLTLQASSAARFKGTDFSTKTASISATSNADATLTVTERLDANASSLGKINYYGNPKNVNKNASSLGAINQK